MFRVSALRVCAAVCLIANVARGENPDEVFAQVRAIITDTAVDNTTAAARLQELQSEGENREIIRYGQAITAARENQWEAVVDYVLHFPDEKYDNVQSLWILAKAAFCRRDFKTFERCLERLTKNLKTQFAGQYQSRTTRVTLEEVQDLDTVLRWRELNSPLAKRILSLTAEVRALDPTIYHRSNEAATGLGKFWPATEPFTLVGFRAAVERERKRIDVARADRERDPELQRIRAIRDEQRYQVEIQNYVEGHRGPRSVYLVTAERAREELERELAGEHENRDLIVPVLLAMYFYPPELNRTLGGGFEALVAAGVSDAIALKWMRLIAPGATQGVKISAEDHLKFCRVESLRDFSRAQAAGTATVRLRHTLLLAALVYRDPEWIRALDTGPELAVADDLASAAIQVLAAVDGEDEKLILPRIVRYFALLPDDSVATERKVWMHRRLLVYFIDALEAQKPETSKVVRAKLEAGLERVRLNLRETPAETVMQMKITRFTEGTPKSLAAKRDLRSFTEDYADQAHARAWARVERPR